MILPIDGQALAQLSREGLPVPAGQMPALVWLDDAGPADLEALTATVLDTIAGRAVLAVTITAGRRQEILRTGSEVGATARAALGRAAQCELPFPLTAKERAEAEQLYPKERFAEASSIAETLVGGPELLAKYRAARDSNPAGCALAQAAVDCRRGGLSRPITESELRHLFALYLPTVRAGLPPTGEQFTAGLAWATEPIASQVALLNRDERAGDTPSWTVLDYAASADDGAGGHPPRPIPDWLWTELLDIVPPADAGRVAHAAYQRDNITAATTILRRVTDSGDADAAPTAAVGLGALLAGQGDVAGARRAYQFAIDSGHTDYAPQGAAGLESLLAEQGEVRGEN